MQFKIYLLDDEIIYSVDLSANFNIHGNKFRLIVDIEYILQIIFIVWISTHAEYDKIDAKNIVYDKAR